jgi:hypothetical protein
MVEGVGDRGVSRYGKRRQILPLGYTKMKKRR